MSSTACKVVFVSLILGLGCGGGDKPGDTSEPLAVGSVPDDHVATAPPSDEEDDDDGLAVEGLKGHLDPAQVEAGLAPHHKAIARCYESQFKRHKYLGGKIQIEAVVGPDGAVQAVRILESEIGSWAVEKCLVDLVRSAVFASPKGGDKIATFVLPLSFSGKIAVLWWPEEKIESHVEENRLSLEACSSDVSGPSDAWVTFYVGVGGKVKSVGVSSKSEEISDEWASCVVDAVSEWGMPDPLGRMAKSGFAFSP